MKYKNTTRVLFCSFTQISIKQNSNSKLHLKTCWTNSRNQIVYFLLIQINKIINNPAFQNQWLVRHCPGSDRYRVNIRDVCSGVRDIRGVKWTGSVGRCSSVWCGATLTAPRMFGLCRTLIYWRDKWKQWTLVYKRTDVLPFYFIEHTKPIS